MYFDTKNNSKVKFYCVGCLQPRKPFKNNLCYQCISCTGKESFSSIKSAKSSVIWRDGSQFLTFSRRDTQYLTPYLCAFCDKYHIGHADIKKKEA